MAGIAHIDGGIAPQARVPPSANGLIVGGIFDRNRAWCIVEDL